jgi:primase-polymerase (primpol)-like protein
MSKEHHPEHAAGYAEALRERFETQGMLSELQGYPNFVVWRYRVMDGQRKKPPFNPKTHEAARPTEPRSWGTLETALTAVASGRYQGIGFMLSQSPFTGLDLDHSVSEGKLLPWAKDIVEEVDSYTEFSPSWNKTTGTGGLHLLIEGKPLGSKKAGNIEVYGEKHYLTITTNHLPETPATINSRQEALDALYRRLAPPAPARRHYRLHKPIQRGLCAGNEAPALDRGQYNARETTLFSLPARTTREGNPANRRHHLR